MVKAHSSLTNKPATGCPENWAYGTVQINIAPAIRQKDIGTERGSLGREIGEFGLDHFDEGDDVGPVTHMASYQNVPDGYLPGMFFVLQLGVFVCLEEYRGINFSGRRKHGGTAPVCPTDHPMDLRSWAIRFVGIHYPPARIFSASVRASLAALPNNEAFFMAPEMVNTGYFHSSFRLLTIHLYINQTRRLVATGIHTQINLHS
jgi:hypothetical protein